MSGRHCPRRPPRSPESYPAPADRCIHRGRHRADAAIIYFGGPETPVATLGLGIGTTPDVVLPIVDVQGGSLLVTANVLDGWSGVFPGSATRSETFYGGGTIALDYGGSLEVDGSRSPPVSTIDMRGNYTNKLVLDGVSSGATNAFAGMIVDFTQGDTITALGNVQADTATYNAGVLTLMTGGQVDAKLDVAGTVGANLVLGNFIVTQFSLGWPRRSQEILVPPPPRHHQLEGRAGRGLRYGRQLEPEPDPQCREQCGDRGGRHRGRRRRSEQPGGQPANRRRCDAVARVRKNHHRRCQSGIAQ